MYIYILYTYYFLALPHARSASLSPFLVFYFLFLYIFLYISLSLSRSPSLSLALSLSLSVPLSSFPLSLAVSVLQFLPVPPFYPRLAILGVLKLHPNSLCLMAPVCSSFSWMCSAQSQREWYCPLGDESREAVRVGNLLANRWGWGGRIPKQPLLYSDTVLLHVAYA